MPSTLSSEIRSVLATGLARQRQAYDQWTLGNGPWWRPFRKYKELKADQSRILHALWRFAPALYFAAEFPDEDELARIGERCGAAWRVNQAMPPERFQETDIVSREGSWCLYVAPRPLVARLPDTFRAAPDETLRFMQRYGVEVLVDAFHDDWDWCITLNDAMTEKRTDIAVAAT